MKAKDITRIGLLLALEVVLSRFLSFELYNIRIGLGFLPIAILGMLYGPWIASFGALSADFLGASFFAKNAPYYPGFSLSAFLTGLIFGLLLYNHHTSKSRILISVATIILLISLGLNTFWLTRIYGYGFFVILPGRILQALVMIPLQYISISFVGKQLFRLNLAQ